MEKESIKVLCECIELQNKKSNDYQNPNSRIKQSDYYPRGLYTITDICWAKLLRIYSVLEAMEKDNNYSPNYESIEDSYKDLINYSSFAVSWIRGKIDGQKNNSNNEYKFVGYFEGKELSVILNYLLKHNFNYKLNNNNVLVDVTNLDNDGFNILCNHLFIELSKC